MLDKRLFAELRSARLSFGAAVTLGVMGGVLLVLQAFLLSRIINRVFLEGAKLADVQRLLVWLVAVVIIRAGAVWLSDVAAHQVSHTIKYRLRHQLFGHLVALGPAYTQHERSGELSNTLSEGIDTLDAYFSEYVPRLTLAALVPITILVVVFPLDFLSGVVLLLTAPLIPFFMILIGKYAGHMTRQRWGILSLLSAHFLDVLQGLTTLKLFGRSHSQQNTIASVSDEFRQATMGVLRVAFLSALVLELLATISTAIVAVQIGLRLLHGHINFEAALFILILAPEFYMPLRALGASVQSATEGTAAAERIFAVLDTSPGITASGAMPPPPFTIRFDRVSYTYGERPALHDITFAIHPGQNIALVGASGSGKSTLAQLLLRFIDPQHGSILINDVQLKATSPDKWRQMVGWVPQSPYLFNDTVRANIELARPAADLEAVITAAKLAHAHDFIQTLPDGYNTRIGEQGARLSGGQAQRLALARAFLRDAPLLILDEATSNLDPEQETLIQDAINRLMEKRTVLTITHRLNTAYQADQIIVLDKGHLVQRGPHATLIEQPGVYRELVQHYTGASL